MTQVQITRATKVNDTDPEFFVELITEESGEVQHWCTCTDGVWTVQVSRKLPLTCDEVVGPFYLDSQARHYLRGRGVVLTEVCCG